MKSLGQIGKRGRRASLSAASTAALLALSVGAYAMEDVAAPNKLGAPAGEDPIATLTAKALIESEVRSAEPTPVAALVKPDPAPVKIAAAAPQKLTAPTGMETSIATPSSKPIHNRVAPDDSEVSVVLNKSSIITTKKRFRELSVGNSDIADVVPLSRNRFYILGKQIGSTNIVLTDARGGVIDVIDVLVGYDIQSLKRKIYEVAPDDAVEVRTANNSILLSGSVDSADKAGHIAALAERYGPGRVTNMMSVSGSQQVMLQVKFAEVQRSALKDFNKQLSVTDLDGGGSFFSPGEFAGRGLDGINPFNYFAGSATLVKAGDYSLGLVFDALEEKGLVRTLAEPNIIALSGDTASFLAGGEFPIPIAQEGGNGGFTITIEFKEFGVGLDFTPTVVGKDKINLELRAEVSSIDPTVSVTTGDITIPGLNVRRTNTTVELLDGQSFAIAGLIQDDLTTTVRQIPGLGSIPIIGALARSEGYQRRETELVVVITARLVKPVSSKNLAVPTDHFLPPKEFDLFLFGNTHELSSISGAGGVDGNYGYETP